MLVALALFACHMESPDHHQDATVVYESADEERQPTVPEGRQAPRVSEPPPTDLDGDGALSDVDCNDQDASVSPFAPEVCNGIDDDCDGAIDAHDADALDALPWYADHDGDGLGDPTQARRSCTQPADYVPNDLDCSDQQAHIGIEGCHDLSDPARLTLRVNEGVFLVGSPKYEVGRRANERHRAVYLPHDVLLGALEVTVGAWRAFTGEEPPVDTGCLEDDCPVFGLSWHEAAAFTNLISTSEGLASCYSCEQADDGLACSADEDVLACEGYRLPTELEWERAARAGSEEAFGADGSLVESPSCDADATLSNGVLLEAYATFCSERPSPVGSRYANPWGMFDAHGNVPEWTHDGGVEGHTEVHARRGGGWVDAPGAIRSASRQVLPAHRAGGVRLARTLFPELH
jgi:formylglycine-generating enzyme required for sulfatase activity